MIKYILCFLCFLSGYSFGSALSLPVANIICKEKLSNGYYKYEIHAVAKNISKNDLILITNTTNSHNKFNGEFKEIVLDEGESSINGVKIIPTDYELGLVKIGPSEGGRIKGVTVSKELYSDVIITYHMPDLYEGRFKNWTGSVSSDITKTIIRDGCKP
ncbi:MAG: hypothetical protein K6L76_06550 [Agarilytica sp.]